MKRFWNVFGLLMAAGFCFAQQGAPQASNDCYGWLPGYPAHYCECRQTSQVFSFPLEQQLTDTMWFSSTVNDLKQGLSAYWFANSSITFEVYAFCSSKTPTISLTVGANQMREMDVAAINQKLDEMGETAQLMSQTLTPRIKVYPNGGSGTVYCYPFDQGPLSTCENILPMIPRMTYVCSDTTEVYELKPANISAKGNGFIRWKQKKNFPATLRLTEGSCTGPEIANVTLSDSLRVYVLDPVRMRAAKTAGNSIFVHVTHPAGYVGRIVYRNTILWDEQRIDTTICQGKSLQLTDTVLTQTTVYPNDTLLKAGDTLSMTTYHLTIVAPEPQYDTLLLKAAQLPTTYRNQYIARNGWGDYDFTIHQVSKCDERYLVHVKHDIVTRETVVDTTVCMGKTITYGGVAYSKDTVISDSAWADADTWTVSSVTIRFSEPEEEFDTIAVPLSQMTASGYWYSGLGVLVKGYGDTLIVKTQKNKCTRWINLTVVVGEEPIDHTDLRDVPFHTNACKFIRDGVLYIRRDGQDYDLFGRPVK